MSFLCCSNQNVIIPFQNNFNRSEQILHWKSNKKIYKYHWWPMKETSVNANDPINNLYARSGALSKYDKIFGTKSVEYQKANHFRKCGSKKSDANWAGFCDLATILSCLYKYPEKSVKVEKNGKVFTFTPKDIEALMIVSCNNATDRWKTEFYGERNNGTKYDDEQEPYPTKLLEILRTICKSKKPFAMDITCGTAVWNYSFDSVEVFKTYQCPKKFLKKIPMKGKTRFLKFNINSSVYTDSSHELWGYINICDGIETEGWLSKYHPDFLWRKHEKIGEWTGKSSVNPYIDTNIIYNIYLSSIDKNTKKPYLYF